MVPRVNPLRSTTPFQRVRAAAGPDVAVIITCENTVTSPDDGSSFAVEVECQSDERPLSVISR
jgi:hypothetical protein